MKWEIVLICKDFDGKTHIEFGGKTGVTANSEFDTMWYDTYNEAAEKSKEAVEYLRVYNEVTGDIILEVVQVRIVSDRFLLDGG